MSAARQSAIADELAGWPFRSGGTVDSYVHYIRRKTDRDLISTIRGVGYRLGTPA